MKKITFSKVICGLFASIFLASNSVYAMQGEIPALITAEDNSLQKVPGSPSEVGHGVPPDEFLEYDRDVPKFKDVEAYFRWTEQNNLPRVLIVGSYRASFSKLDGHAYLYASETYENRAFNYYLVDHNRDDVTDFCADVTKDLSALGYGQWDVVHFEAVPLREAVCVGGVQETFKLLKPGGKLTSTIYCTPGYLYANFLTEEELFSNIKARYEICIRDGAPLVLNETKIRRDAKNGASAAARLASIVEPVLQKIRSAYGIYPIDDIIHHRNQSLVNSILEDPQFRNEYLQSCYGLDGTKCRAGVIYFNPAVHKICLYPKLDRYTHDILVIEKI